MPSDFPLQEFDAGRGVIEPGDIHRPHPQMPRQCILTLHPGQIDKIAARPDTRLLFQLRSCMGVHPIYVIEFEGRRIALAHPGLGAPLSVGLTEEIIARGGRQFIVTGTCGVLDGSIARGEAMLVRSALRDEGTSYHYQPASRFAEASQRIGEVLREQLIVEEVSYREATSWTTDAFYRETPEKIRRRREEGCDIVEMECSALFALGRFRRVDIGALLWAADDVTGKAWEQRKGHTPATKPDELLEVVLRATGRL
ncbi:MAG: nucleoside phosphorylase [Candidatus Sumerlaeota bacterium]